MDMINDSKDKVIAFLVSVLFHIILVVIVVVFSGHSNNTKRMPSVIDIDLMSFSAPSVKKKSENKKKKDLSLKKKSKNKKKKTLSSKKTRQAKVRKARVKKKKIILPSKHKKIKKKVVNSQDIINDAIKRLRQDLDKTKPDSLAERMQSLEKEIKADKRELAESDYIDPEIENTGGGDFKLVTQYVSYVKIAVQENWAFSKNLAASEKNLETSVVFKVMPDGEIKEVNIIKKSGNSYMDSAASMAVIRTSPLEPFSNGINERYLTIGIDFTPQ